MSSHTESFGLVLLEAMSQSVVCIAFDSASGARNLLKEDRGILIPNRDKEEYAKSVVSLLKDTNKINKLNKNAYEYIKIYDIKNIQTMWLDLLECRTNKNS